MDTLSHYSSQVMFLLGISMLISILLRRSFRYFRRSRVKDNSPIVKVSRPDFSHTRSPRDRDLDRRQVEMHETARDLKAELDSKMIALQHLTRLASEQADRLEAVIARAGQSATLPKGAFSQRIDALSAVVPPSPHEQPDSSYFRQTIMAFSEQGFTPEQISQQVDLSLAEVLAILESSEDESVGL